MRSRRSTLLSGVGRLGGAVSALLLSFVSSASAQVAAGYSEYFIPGNETQMRYVFNNLDGAGANYGMHSVITVTAWSANTTVYYDHWEDGYDFDPANPATADETVVLLNTGDQRVFQSANIPTNPRGTATYYDGGDRIYVAGGTVTVTRASWIEAVGVGNQAAAWEIYPIKPQLTTYVMPIGENLGFADFERVYALIQATADGTIVTVDLDGNGTADPIDWNHDGAADGTSITLSEGQSVLLDRTSAHPGSTTTPLNSGAVIQGTATLQVKFVAGDPGQLYCARGLSAFPRGYWTKDYYAPLDQPTGAAASTDYYLFNPHSSAITVNWESRTASGSFTIPPSGTVSFRTAAGAVPVDSGLYFRGSDTFWGVGVGDAGGAAYEWGYSLLPSTFLYQEHFLGWAPGSSPPGQFDNDGAFLTVAQDDTRVFVDYDDNGTVDQTYTLDRLQTQFIYDPNDGDLSRTHFWATGPFTISYGENANTATTSSPSLDLGYVAIPGTDFISLVLTVDKSVTPQVVPTASGSQASFTITVRSQKYSVNGLGVVDTLPPGWQYVAGTATITLPDMTTSAADPTIAGAGTAANPYLLAWPSAALGSMAENQAITITFTGQTTQPFAAGDISQNRVRAVGTRTLGSPAVTQTFTATDFAYVTHGSLQITKTSNAATPLYPGDRFRYTVTVTNPPGSPTLTGLSLYDALPAGVSAVAGTTLLNGPMSTVGDRFGTAPYSNNGGSRNWAGDWVDSQGDGPSAGDIRIVAGELRLGRNSRNIYRQVNLSAATTATLAFSYRTSGNVEDGEWAYVEVASSAAGPWTTVLSFQNDASGTVSSSIPAGLLSATTTVRIRTASYDNNEYFFVDDVFVYYDVADDDVRGGDSPTLLDSSINYTLAAGRSVTASFDVIVDDPLPTGLTTITNTASATSAQLPIQVSASVTNLVANPSYLTASVAGRLWLDGDSDSVQDLGEPGIANVELTLKDQWGTPVATTRADANGRYQFAGVTPGNGYYVDVTDGLPAGLSQTFPVGRSDDRTAGFNLSDGQQYVGVDLGYGLGAGTAAFGDTAWVDANGNGLRDPGEVALGGVAVTLYRDANGNGRLDEGTDVVVATTTTSAAGSYLFTGVAPGPTYIVSAISPSGYSPTTGMTFVFPNVAGGGACLTADFGFGSTSPTYFIADRVWLDGNGDGLFESGEAGIPGVTVELLDSSLNVIATTSTGGDGTFVFRGVRGGGADYTVRINDTTGVLASYYGTTSYAQALRRAESNIIADVERSSPPSPSYGFGVTRAVGDTVFSDLNGNGAQDAGEPGLAGVVVSLYRDSAPIGLIDNNGDHLIDEPLVGEVTTDGWGRYLFSGLAIGNYVVSAPIPGGYSSTGPGGDSDPVAAGIQKAVAMTGTSIDTVDFGFHTATQRALSGTVWSDTNANGEIDVGESGVAGVTLQVLDGTTVVATLTTGASGAFSAAGLTARSYTVRITDSGGVLTGYSTTYERTEGTTSPFNYQETVDLSSGDVTDVDFGLQHVVPTYAAVAYLKAYLSGGSVTVEWRTSLEVGTAGFHLLRLDPATNRYRRVTDRLIPGLVVHPQGGTYRIADPGAPLEGPLSYKLLERDVRRRLREYGPYVVTVGGEAASGGTGADPAETGAAGEGQWVSAGSAGDGRTRQLRSGGSHADGEPAAERYPARLSGHREAALREAQAERRATSRTRLARSGVALKVTTGEAGLHYVPAVQIAASLGVPFATAARLIASGGVTLANRARPVPYLPAARGEGLYFYATPVDSPYTAENVYWITPRRGVTMARTGAASTGAPAASFPATVHSEEDRYPLLIYFQDPAADFWTWEYLFAGYDGLDSLRASMPVNDVAGYGACVLTAHLMGGTDSERVSDHHVQVLWNGEAVGEDRWDGLASRDLVIPLDAGQLREGDNVIEVKALLDAGVPESIVLVDSFDLSYERLYRAEDDRLAFSAPDAAALRIAGFSSPSLLLFDVTDPDQPSLVTGYDVSPAGDGTYALSFGTSPDAPSRARQSRPGLARAGRYLAVASNRATSPKAVVAWQDRGLRRSSSDAEYVLIAPDTLVDAARRLADYRNSRGITTAVVELEAIYDEFNHGLASPDAIREYLRYLRGRGTTPRYVTLVGRGTYDYMDRQGLGDNLLPPALVGSSDGLVASDGALADLAGDDGLPELAIGRLPVVTSQELLDYVAKIETYEGAAKGQWQDRVLMVADNPDPGGAFPADSETVAALVPPDHAVQRVYLSTTRAAAARQAIITGLNEGVSIFNYIGHGALDLLAQEGIFTSSDVASLANGERLTALLAMTCSLGDFAMPGYPSLGETMVLAQGRGAYAVWAASGLSRNDLAVRLDRHFFQAAFAERGRPIGDVVLQALRETDVSEAPSTRYMYNLLGEPVSRLPE